MIESHKLESKSDSVPVSIIKVDGWLLKWFTSPVIQEAARSESLKPPFQWRCVGHDENRAIGQIGEQEQKRTKRCLHLNSAKWCRENPEHTECHEH